MDEYRFVDVGRLVRFEQRLGISAPRVGGRTSFKGGPVAFERGTLPPSLGTEIDLRIREVEDSARADGLLGGLRPQSIRDYSESDALLYVEEVTAVRVQFPDKVTESAGVRHPLTVWVADPDLEVVAEAAPWSIEGSFLLLTQAGDDQDLAERFPFHSGCSALQALANVAVGRDYYPPGRDHSGRQAEWEPLGRGNSSHPVDKLRSIGGVSAGTARIRSLYSVRYMSNEQVFMVDDAEVRVCDVLGYPIYVKAIGDPAIDAEQSLQGLVLLPGTPQTQ